MEDEVNIQLMQPGSEKMGTDSDRDTVTQQPMGGMESPPIPAGLHNLAALNRVDIHQLQNLRELALGFEENNRYQILNEQNRQCMEAKENTNCMSRWCLGTMRPFVIDIHNMHGPSIIQLSRGCNCQGCCFPCCLQEMYIHYPVGKQVATMKEKWSCLRPIFEIVDINDQLLFSITGPKCYCKWFTDVTFEVTRPDNSPAGAIVKHWNGCDELFGGVNTFSVEFAPDETPINKAILLSATFLVDFRYFEHYKGC